MKKFFYTYLILFNLYAFSADYDFSSYTNYLSKEIKNGNYPGFVTLVYQNGEVIFSDTRGYADLDDETPLKEDSLFRIYSMSKPITGAALMILVENPPIQNLPDGRFC